MFKNIFFFFIVLCFANNNLNAQQSDQYFSVGIIPTYMLEPITPSIGLAVEYRIFKNIHLELMYGLDPNVTILNWHPDRSSRHHEYKGILKYIVSREPNDGYFTYFGIDYFGVYDKYNRRNSFYVKDGTHYNYNEAEVTRTIKGARLSYGANFPLGKNVWMDVFCGAGFRRINIQYDTQGGTINNEPTTGEWFTPFDRDAGIKTKLSYIMGVKFAYRIR